jgi:hypothetical protein
MAIEFKGAICYFLCTFLIFVSFMLPVVDASFFLDCSYRVSRIRVPTSWSLLSVRGSRAISLYACGYSGLHNDYPTHHCQCGSFAGCCLHGNRVVSKYPPLYLFLYISLCLRSNSSLVGSISRPHQNCPWNHFIADDGVKSVAVISREKERVGQPLWQDRSRQKKIDTTCQIYFHVCYRFRAESNEKTGLKRCVSSLEGKSWLRRGRGSPTLPDTFPDLYLTNFATLEEKKSLNDPFFFEVYYYVY